MFSQLLSSPKSSRTEGAKTLGVAVLNTLSHVLVCLCAILALQQTIAPKKSHPLSDLQRQQSYEQHTSPWIDNSWTRQLTFLKSDTQPPLNDDDVQPDDTCRNYLLQFLNGTTDENDECQGMYTAWSAADCPDSLMNQNRRHRRNRQQTQRFRFLLADTNSHNSSDQNTDDDDDSNDSTDSTNLIDDMFEEWECCESIGKYYSKHCQEESLDATRLFGIVAVLIACWLAKSILKYIGWHWIPDAGACILVGALVGGVLRILWTADLVNTRMVFNNNLFLQILLPPIIFEAALSIDKRAFRRDLFPIITFAIAGTGFSAVAIGYITYAVSAWTSTTALPLLDSLLFGALMSSIDPVATLSILSGVGVGQGDTLYTLVFGESLLNDGVSIVLFDSLVRHVGDVSVVGKATVTEVLYHFFLVTLGSTIVGVICGALCTFYFWAMQGKNTAVSEGALFFTWALIPYYIADALEMSGIISIMVMGFMLDYFVIGGFQDDRSQWNRLSTMDEGNDMMNGLPVDPMMPFSERLKEWCAKAFSGKGHLQERARSHVGYVAEVISSIVETAIFAYLGLFLFNDKEGDFKLTGAGIFACVSSRAVMVIVLCALINICVFVDLETKLTNLWRTLRGRGGTVNARQAYELSQNKSYLGPRTQFILFTAGIRGAVSYALVQNIPVYDSVSRHGSLFKGELRAMTSATIVGVLFVFGALTYFGVDRSMASSAHTEGDATLSQMLMEENLDGHAHQLAASQEEQDHAATYEFHVQHQQHQPQHPGPQQIS